jgi:hypothetical protein
MGCRTRLLAVDAFGSLLALVSGCGGSDRSAGSRCAGARQSCSRTIQAALDAAHDGDTIRLERGTFSGGITIDKSVKLVGAGAGQTIVRGGGPVVTIGRNGVRKALTVSIAGVTITGGVARRDPRGRCGADVPTCGIRSRDRPGRWDRDRAEDNRLDPRQRRLR